MLRASQGRPRYAGQGPRSLGNDRHFPGTSRCSLIQATSPVGPVADFIRTGIATVGAVALGGCGRSSAPPASVSTGSAADLDELARRIRGRFLRDGSPLYEDARRVWNLAYDRRPLAMARCEGVDDVRRCVEFAQRHSIPVAIRGGGHSYAGFGVADRALQIRSRRIQHRHRGFEPPSRVGRRRHENQGVAHRNLGRGTLHAHGRLLATSAWRGSRSLAATPLREGYSGRRAGTT